MSATATRRSLGPVVEIDCLADARELLRSFLATQKPKQTGRLVKVGTADG